LNDARQAAPEIQPPKNKKRFGIGDMLPITGRTNSSAQIILGQEQSYSNAF
jgi:hypothetical protein